MEINLKPTPKQFEGYEVLRDDETYYLVFGGAAGGGKSWFGCEWLMTMAIAYPNTRWFIGRNELTTLMGSTFITWTKVCKHHNFKDWKLNGQYHFIELNNGSRIDLLDLKNNPSDPFYERYGSREYTGGWIEESGEVEFNAFDTLKSRIGRHLNKEYNIKPKLLLTCNPKKNWLYQKIYKPFKANQLPIEYKFIQSLYGDNPHTAEDYGKMLSQITDRIQKERLMYGNWEYSDDDNALMTYDNIQDLFTNTITENENKWLVADVARYGSDRTVISYWKGLHCYKIETFEKLGVDEVSEKLKIILRDEHIPYSHCIVDEDGVGGGVVDTVRGVKGFMANRTPFDDRITGKPSNFKNLKTQCVYTLADKVNAHEIKITCSDEIKQSLSEELSSFKRKDPDKEGKLEIEPKDKMKEMLGRSPDIADTLLMRMYFEFISPTKAFEKLDPIQIMLSKRIERNNNNQLNYN